MIKDTKAVYLEILRLANSGIFFCRSDERWFDLCLLRWRSSQRRESPTTSAMEQNETHKEHQNTNNNPREPSNWFVSCIKLQCTDLYVRKDNIKTFLTSSWQKQWHFWKGHPCLSKLEPLRWTKKNQQVQVLVVRVASRLSIDSLSLYHQITVCLFI